ncbi:hypothetical protein ERO13_A11G160400v2 [Gossypium hirsutum]|uniref:Uncharacterized protein n=4 Tax=Gossypium TaxID=3633 RepID=A0A1U8I9I7_GOSHI|nr:uncharacterized protein LOC107891999 [Gossypium hirsutum]KAG4175044.1 hypothetical protein ERO13_A11G160400v2 [Gossypium hirsutum]TYG94345.1 hypothetical protein ES288_A11G181700v1 [Gossypium darwinii]TYI01146.1 hypothetical protein ES332_A11G181600v1 [Gossypium tomentosum]TYJ09927.1 hypothetical protein E1A91_A11G173300v1 [Gossypium mustelinum]
MVHMIRFTAGLLILLFFVLHALNSCSVHAQQGRETAGEGSVTRKEFNGRKIGGHEVTMPSKNSGGKNGAESVSIGKSQHQPKNQVSGVNKLEAKTSNFAGLGTPRNGGNNVESEKLLEATKEIVKLMQEDYRGRPRRKPPINNHVPRH